MQMTPNEIVKSYKEAKEKKKQIEILAQLNACPVTTIREILIANGVQFPGPKPKKAKEEKTKVVAVISKDAPTLPAEKVIPEIPRWVKGAVEERINRLDEEIKTMKAELEEKRVELIELSEWLQRVKEV